MKGCARMAATARGELYSFPSKDLPNVAAEPRFDRPTENPDRIPTESRQSPDSPTVVNRQSPTEPDRAQASSRHSLDSDYARVLSGCVKLSIDRPTDRQTDRPTDCDQNTDRPTESTAANVWLGVRLRAERFLCDNTR